MHLFNKYRELNSNVLEYSYRYCSLELFGFGTVFQLLSVVSGIIEFKSLAVICIPRNQSTKPVRGDFKPADPPPLPLLTEVDIGLWNAI